MAVVLEEATGLAAMVTAAPSSGSCCCCPAAVAALAVMVVVVVAAANPAEAPHRDNSLRQRRHRSRCLS